MRAMNLLNHVAPGVVLHWGNDQSKADRPDLDWVPYMGGYVVVAPGKVLPPEADVLAQQPVYEATLAARKDAVQTVAERARIDSEIATLERKQARAVREHVALDDPTAKARLKTIDDQIVTLRASRP